MESQTPDFMVTFVISSLGFITLCKPVLGFIKWVWVMFLIPPSPHFILYSISNTYGVSATTGRRLSLSPRNRLLFEGVTLRTNLVFHDTKAWLSSSHSDVDATSDSKKTKVEPSLKSAIFKTWLLSISIVAIIVPGTGYTGPSMNPANASVSLNVWQPEVVHGWHNNISRVIHQVRGFWCSRGAAGADEDANGTEDFLRAPGVQTPVI
ncbi:hypothetical protein F3Y22_tig00112491pilonHSYRG00082 [Hibiscus syriacus]|uniref:Uncharacterized protein n=1 Tax=Hibiscus syriacus TaxID=106335 RepID=A0A6A2Y3F5_HIBSY|nr:hypothetical protein F3Y22_tig00112491pilonHSYRG00082 [Hibiscus syriacus]